MGTIVLHLGTHKTGSSSIQASLYAGISDQGSIYLDLERQNHSGPTSQICMPDPSRYHANRRLSLSVEESLAQKRRYFKKLSEGLASLGDKTGIISAEDAWGLSRESLGFLRDLVIGFGHSIHVIVYIRPPKSYMQSPFQQRVKAGQGEFEVERVYPKYERLTSIQNVFQDRNVVLSHYAGRTSLEMMS